MTHLVFAITDSFYFFTGESRRNLARNKEKRTSTSSSSSSNYNVIQTEDISNTVEQATILNALPNSLEQVITLDTLPNCPEHCEKDQNSSTESLPEFSDACMNFLFLFLTLYLIFAYFSRQYNT